MLTVTELFRRPTIRGSYHIDELNTIKLQKEQLGKEFRILYMWVTYLPLPEF